MDSTHLHLLLNHFPIIGTLIGVLVLAYGLLTKSRAVQLVACYLLIAMTVVAYPVMETGEGAEDTVEKLAGVSKTIMHNHEEAAEVAFWVMIAGGVLALIAVVLHFLGNTMFTIAIAATLIASATAFGFMARTGYIGGQIRHTEIHSPSLQNSLQQDMNTGSANDGDD